MGLQKRQVLSHLKTSPITSRDAMRTYDIYRLADVIFNLRGDGYDISTEIFTTSTGKRCGRYHLVKEAG